jgi:hypothetical protein
MWNVIITTCCRITISCFVRMNEDVTPMALHWTMLKILGQLSWSERGFTGLTYHFRVGLMSSLSLVYCAKAHFKLNWVVLCNVLICLCSLTTTEKRMPMNVNLHKKRRTNSIRLLVNERSFQLQYGYIDVSLADQYIYFLDLWKVRKPKTWKF